MPYHSIVAPRFSFYTPPLLTITPDRNSIFTMF